MVVNDWLLWSALIVYTAAFLNQTSEFSLLLIIR